MNQVFNKYYRSTLISSLMVTTVTIFSRRSDRTFLENLLYVLAYSAVLTLIGGTLYYLQDTKWGPAKRRKMLGKSPFTHLLAERFILKGDSVAGIINNYTVIIFYNWPNAVQAIKVMVLFSPESLNRPGFALEDLETRNKKGFFGVDYVWTNNSLAENLDYTFTPPTYDKVMATAHELLEIAFKESLLPISYEDHEKLIAALPNNAAISL